MFEAVQAFLRRVPYKGVVLIALGMQLIQECYPFSHFPMYSSLSRNTDYFYVTDGADRPLPTKRIFGIQTEWVKKIYNTRRQQADGQKHSAAAAQAGRDTLVYLLARIATKPEGQALAQSGLKLVRVAVVLQDGRIDRTQRVVATLPPPG